MISGVSIAETTRAKKAFKESLTKQLDGERVCMQVGVYVNVVCNCCKQAYQISLLNRLYTNL